VAIREADGITIEPSSLRRLLVDSVRAHNRRPESPTLLVMIRTERAIGATRVGVTRVSVSAQHAVEDLVDFFGGEAPGGEFVGADGEVGIHQDGVEVGEGVRVTTADLAS
jgi:hypothetical protein